MEKVSKNPLISVIVPVYNVEKYIKKCLDSIIAQTYTNLEIILIDDGSKDDSGKICDEYAKKDNRIVIIHKRNCGVSASRNSGLKMSRGQYISFIDADDWIELNYYEKMMQICINQKTDIVQCSYNRVSENKKEEIKLKKGIYDSKEYLIMSLSPQTAIGFCHMKVYNKHILRDILFDEDLMVGEDALFNERIAKNTIKISIIEDTLYNYRINQQSVTKKYDESYSKKYEYSMEKNKKYILSNYSDKEVSQALYNYIAFHTLLISTNYCCNKVNKNKIKSLKIMRCTPVFKDAIEKCNYDNLSLSRKIALFTIKYKLYFITELICLIRQKQNRR